ncbi:hypothetical protein Barb4_00904 [Bacteroidales bacterium Barb4]|nr:hypothetical protein Barb4_00904 [Bacteroidales bacterium Barb4]
MRMSREVELPALGLSSGGVTMAARTMATLSVLPSS